jgi:hypothetical protein
MPEKRQPTAAMLALKARYMARLREREVAKAARQNTQWITKEEFDARLAKHRKGD